MRVMRRTIVTVAIALLLLACEKKAPPLPTIERAPASTPDAAASPAPSATPPSTNAAPLVPMVTDTFPTSKGLVTVTPIRHATVVLGFDGKTIGLDPWSQAPAGWLPKADLVLITDIHRDHFDRDGISAVRKDGTVLIAPEVVQKELPEAKILKNGARTEHFGVSIRAVPMYNLKRGPEPGKLFHDKGRGNGYLLGFGDKTF